MINRRVDQTLPQASGLWDDKWPIMDRPPFHPSYPCVTQASKAMSGPHRQHLHL
jgi:hypothetical protein